MAQDNANGRVDWSVQLSASGSSNRLMLLQSHSGSYDADWTVEMSAVNTFTAAAGQGTQIGLMVFNSEGLSSGTTADYVKLVLQQAPATGDGDSIHYGLHSNGNANPGTVTAFNGNSSVLKMNYSASAHTIATYYDSNLIATYGIANSGGFPNQDWGMSSGSTFVIGIYAQSAATMTGYTLSPGTAYADSITISGMTAIPEPSTYAALAGVAALGLAFWRRRRAA